MLDAYFSAFDEFLNTGATTAIAGILGERANPALMSVYRNGYFRTCTDALAGNYPVVRAIVGDDYFRDLARGYVNQHPPTRSTLVGYGEHLADFIRQLEEEHGLDYLADAAAIDAAWLKSYFAEEGVPLAPADIEHMGANEMDVTAVRVHLTPHVQLVQIENSIIDTWATLRDQGELTETVALTKRAHLAMLWRLDGHIHIKALNDAESVFIDTLAKVATLGDAAACAYKVDESFDLAGTFAALLQNNILRLEDQFR
jgi:hypothetical protein